MYSVVLTVEDAAGNAALARGLFLWDAQSRVTTTNTPMSVPGASAVSDNVVWLTSPVDSFVVNWSGHFENAFQHDNKLLNKVKPWPEDKGNFGLSPRWQSLKCPSSDELWQELVMLCGSTLEELLQSSIILLQLPFPKRGFIFRSIT